MTLPLCPTCGSTLKAVRGLSDASLSCLKCGWKTNRGPKNELQGRGGADTSFLRQMPSKEEARDIFGTLLNIPKPRKLSWSWRMKAAVSLLTAMMFFVIWTVVAYLSSGDFRDPLIVLILVGWACALIAFPVLPELPNGKLLREGELVVGRVIHQETFSGSRDTWTVIFYAFADGANRGFIGKGRDYSDSLAHGAPVVVYYDPLNPERNVAMECSRLSVKVP